MRTCFLHGFGPCGGKISGEHYISHSLLNAIDASGRSQVGGLPFQPQGMMQTFGNGALTAKVLCAKHNSDLSCLDAEAKRAFQVFDAIDKDPASVPPYSSIDALLFERWMLKVICGLTAGAGWNDGVVPDEWKAPLIGRGWANHWGLYLPLPSGTQTLAKEFAVESIVQAGTAIVKGARFRVAGVHFTIALGVPDAPSAFGLRYPRGLVFQTSLGERRVELSCPQATDQAVIYTRVGTSTERPPQWDGWKDT